MSLFTLPAGNDLIQYDIDDVKIARNNGNGTFGTLVDVPSCDLFVAGINSKSQTMRGDARITALASASESAEVQIRMGSFSPAVFAIIFGDTSMSSGGVAPNRITDMEISAAQNYPYFSMVGRSPSGLANGGATLIWVPYVKLMQNVSVRVEYNGFMMPEVTGMAVGDPVLLARNGGALLWKIRFYETSPTIAMPLP